MAGKEGREEGWAGVGGAAADRPSAGERPSEHAVWREQGADVSLQYSLPVVRRVYVPELEGNEGSSGQQKQGEPVASRQKSVQSTHRARIT